jgi:DNA-binding NarL/FixJ family response regulator
MQEACQLSEARHAHYSRKKPTQDDRSLIMPGQLAALVVDDDIWSLRFLEGLLREFFPELLVETREVPDCSGQFDLYFIDNDFNGRRVAGELASAIRKHDPDALIIAYSANLDADTLKSLINAGCNGACDKSSHSDVSRAMQVARAFIKERIEAQSRVFGGGFTNMICSVRELLREWNCRLEAEEESTALLSEVRP